MLDIYIYTHTLSLSLICVFLEGLVAGSSQGLQGSEALMDERGHAARCIEYKA